MFGPRRGLWSLLFSWACPRASSTWRLGLPAATLSQHGRVRAAVGCGHRRPLILREMAIPNTKTNRVIDLITSFLHRRVCHPTTMLFLYTKMFMHGGICGQRNRLWPQDGQRGEHCQDLHRKMYLCGLVLKTTPVLRARTAGVSSSICTVTRRSRS